MSTDLKNVLLSMLTPATRKSLSESYALLKRAVPFTAEGRRDRWIRTVYGAHNAETRRRLFLDLAHFCHVNRPYSGYYFEFGCHSARTMRMAWDSFEHLFDFEYVAFDSFEGLPEIAEIDRQEIWARGKLKTAEAEFREICERHGIPKDRLTTVAGFFDASLTPALRSRFSDGRFASIVYIDCDLYESTVPVLEWVKDFLADGSVVVFDEWNAFRADPNRGERRAWREFRERHSDFRFEELFSTPMQKAFICVGRPSPAN
jgi:O-methyltransferase